MSFTVVIYYSLASFKLYV